MSATTPEPDKARFDIGFDAQDPELMLIQVPIAAYAANKEDGMALFIGKMREAESIGSKIIREKRLKAAKGGLVKPGAPLTVQ
jgi:hypothetical protein